MSQTPQAFLSGPAYHVGPTPIDNTPQRPVYVSRMAPRLTVRADGSVHLNAEAARLLPDGDGTIDLRPPIRDRDNWHLDCRPGGHYKRQPVGSSGGVKFKAAARVHAVLGACAEIQHFALEHVGNGLFRLFPDSGNN